MNEKHLKMYILIKKSLPSHKIIAAAHASLMCYLKFQDRLEVQEWVKNSFRKVVCEVSDKEFEAAKCENDYIIVTEMAFKETNHEEVALAFKPRIDWPTEFKFYPLMKI